MSFKPCFWTCRCCSCCCRAYIMLLSGLVLIGLNACSSWTFEAKVRFFSILFFLRSCLRTGRPRSPVATASEAERNTLFWLKLTSRKWPRPLGSSKAPCFAVLSSRIDSPFPDSKAQAAACENHLRCYIPNYLMRFNLSILKVLYSRMIKFILILTRSSPTMNHPA